MSGELPTGFELSQPVWVKSGLTSGFTYNWQEDLIWMASEIRDAWFDPSDSGYEHWEYCANWLIRNKIQDQVMLVHSNGSLFADFIAAKIEPHDLRVRICNFDHTMAAGKPWGRNVPNGMDLYAGFPMRRVRISKGFVAAGNVIERHDYLDESHASILKNLDARGKAIAFCKKWKRSA